MSVFDCEVVEHRACMQLTVSPTSQLITVDNRRRCKIPDLVSLSLAGDYKIDLLNHAIQPRPTNF